MVYSKKQTLIQIHFTYRVVHHVVVVHLVSGGRRGVRLVRRIVGDVHARGHGVAQVTAVVRLLGAQIGQRCVVVQHGRVRMRMSELTILGAV